MTEKHDMFDIGETCPECLYDFAILLTAAQDPNVDRNSELWKQYMAVFNSAWAQLPELVTISFRPED